MNKYLLLLSVFIGPFAQADLASDFADVVKQPKGPFSLNYLQGTEARAEITNSVKAPKGFLFQAAYRNSKARELVSKHDMYLANLFSTNYYELTGEFVYGDAFGNHGLDQNALLSKKDVAIKKATSMVRNWVLEKYYVEKLPDSKLARSFQIRGISDAANELKFATYFFNFYLSALNEDFQYLPTYLLAKNSPISGMASLDKARNLVAQTYDYFVDKFGANDKRVKPIYLIRNAVHNQLSPQVVTMIEEYDKDFPFYRTEGNTYLFEVKKILLEYYSINANKIADLAAKLKFNNIKDAAKVIATEGPQLKNLFSLSTLVAELKAQIQDSSVVAFEKKAETISLISKCSDYLGKEISVMKKTDEKLVYQIILNAIYVEGFLIKDNWDYFKSELDSAADFAAAAQVMSDVLSIGMETIDSAFDKALTQWTATDAKIQNFRDDTIKSSALNLISLEAQKK
jgi:hypothetical protein